MGESIKQQLQEAIQAYDKIAKIYADNHYGKLLQYQLNTFISLLNGKRILDTGCGMGRDVEYFLDEGYDARGIDLSEGMLEEAQQRVPQGSFEKMDMRETSFATESFHGIWCMASLADIPREEAPLVLKEFHRILRKKGILYLAVKHGEGQEIKKKEKYNGLPRIYVYYQKAELEKLLKEQGFTIYESTVTEDNGKEWLEIFAKKKVQ